MVHGGQSRRSERQTGLFLDAAHLVLGTAIVVLAILSFINPEGNLLLFPLVFLLAALLNGIGSVFDLSVRGRDKKRFRLGLFKLVLTAALVFLGCLSAVSIWF